MCLSCYLVNTDYATWWAVGVWGAGTGGALSRYLLPRCTISIAKYYAKTFPNISLVPTTLETPVSPFTPTSCSLSTPPSLPHCKTPCHALISSSPTNRAHKVCSFTYPISHCKMNSLVISGLHHKSSKLYQIFLIEDISIIMHTWYKI